MNKWTGVKGPFLDSVKLNLDLPGILFVEALKKLDHASSQLISLNEEFTQHETRLADRNAGSGDYMAGADAESALFQGIGSFEPACSALVANITLIDIGLTAAAEAYINSVAEQVLTAKEAEHFDRLSPSGKWLFLPRVMGLEWRPELGVQPLQGFSELVVRRNRWLHPKVVRTSDIFDIKGFLKKCGVALPTSSRGVDSVRALISGISESWRGSFGPDWLYPDSEYFRGPCFYIGDVSAPARFAAPDER